MASLPGLAHNSGAALQRIWLLASGEFLQVKIVESRFGVEGIDV